MALTERGAIQMINDKERITQEKAEKIAQRIKEYVDEMDTLSDTSEFKIDSIEEKWGELESFTKQVYKEINDEIVRQYNEKRIVKLKKANTQRKG
jgi:predicted  nucleic acid-binding Zn-ribbon protein